jgi:Tfp pilus assembly protein PilF
MSGIRMVFVVILGLFLLSACASLMSTPAEKQLDNGVNRYEEGDYKSSLTSLQSALDMGLKIKDEQVRAHKYLAFIYCISEREKLCRDEFKKAFEIDSNFDLQPAEAGHPVWGPVFRSVKAKFTK